MKQEQSGCKTEQVEALLTTIDHDVGKSIVEYGKHSIQCSSFALAAGIYAGKFIK